MSERSTERRSTEAEAGAGATLPSGQPRDLKANQSVDTPAQAGEESRRTLANRARTGAIPHDPRKRGKAQEPVPTSTSVDLEPDTVEIVRATSRFEVNVRGCGRWKGLDKCDGKCAACARARATQAALGDVERMVTTARNVAMRELVRRDGQHLDDYLSKHGVMPRRMEDWLPLDQTRKGQTYGYCYSYPRMGLVAPRLGSNIRATLARRVDGDWKRDRYDVLVKQSKQARHFKVGQPIPIPRPAYRFDAGAETGAITMSLFSKEHGDERRISLPIVPRDARQRMELLALATGEFRAGELTIQRDRTRRSRWSVRIAYTRAVPKRQGQTVALVLGMRTFMVAVTESGEAKFCDAHDIEAHLQQMKRRRREYQRGTPFSARRGHGRTRTLAPTTDLAFKHERWRDNRVKTLAASFVDWLVGRRGVVDSADAGRLVILDFSGVRDAPPEALREASASRAKWIWERVQEWPYYQQQLAIANAAAAEGVEVCKTECARSTTRCPNPKCGHDSPENRSFTKWRFTCVKCKTSRNLDVVQALNVLAAVGSGEAALMRMEKETKELAEMARSGEDDERKRDD